MRPACLVTPAVIAHRGASGVFPENTLAAFEAAVQAGADMVELDVRLTADGTLVVMHDPDVARTTAARGLVSEMTLCEMRALGVPTLRDALDLLQGRAGAEVEIKDVPGDAAVAAIAGLLKELRFNTALVSSFQLETLDLAREHDPEVATGLETDGAEALRIGLDHVVEHGLTFLLPDAPSLIHMGKNLVRLAHERGVRIGTWTIDDPATIAELYAWGVDAIETNMPETAVPVRDLARCVAAGTAEK
jgi:glycerophosphoryl diester phosphodiesterase